MKTSIYRVVYLALVIGLAFYPSARAIERLQINSEQDTAYLPYRYMEVVGHKHDRAAKVQYKAAQVVEAVNDETSQACLILARNPDFDREDEPAIFSFCSYPPLRVVSDCSIPLTINDWVIYDDQTTGEKAIASAGYRNDTAWVFRLGLNPARYDFKKAHLKQQLLTVGRDSTGDGLWDPDINFALFEDYDHDGCHEAFIYINSRREANSRLLFCVEMETLEIEWTLPVSAIITNPIYSCGDYLSPAVIFVAYNPQQGYSDPNYDDSYKYLSIVNNKGELTYNRIIAAGVDHSGLTPGGEKGLFYLRHSLLPVDPDSITVLTNRIEQRSSNTEKYFISKVNSQGQFLKTIVVDEMPKDLWLQPYGPGRDTCVYVNFTTKVVRVYDRALNLLAESKPVNLGKYLGSINLVEAGEVQAFGDGLYSFDLTKLTYFPFPPWCLQPVVFDTSGKIRTLVLGGHDVLSIGKITKREFFELLSIAYVKNRIYFLMSLSGLLVGLIVTNYYRRKTKKNLILMVEQKRKLEEAHEALRQAQETIIVQERYRQAQDIAGGFAHEIRNALFPARSALHRLIAAKEDGPPPTAGVHDLLRFSDEAVARAVDLTHLISQYTKLESGREPTPVDICYVIANVIESNKLRIAEQNVAVEMEAISTREVVGNQAQYTLVVNNVMVNALDALTGTKDCAILITNKQIGNYLVVDIADTGPGIAPDDLGRIFDVFFSTKPDTGTGLGLAMVKKIMEMYGGSVCAANRPAGGAAIELRFRMSSDNNIRTSTRPSE